MKTSVFLTYFATCFGLAALTGCAADDPSGDAGATAGSAGAATGGSAGTGGGAGTAGSAGTGDCAPLEPIPPRLWRLSMTQFTNSVRDLLGMPSGPVVNDTGGASEYAFFSDSAAGVSDTLAFGVYQAVQAALTEVRPRIAELAACAEGQTDDECAESFAQTFGARAFRRPLDASEVTSLLAVYAEGRKESFETGIENVLEALLQSPSFLYRSELGTPGATDMVLTPHETATQLGYLFLDSTPDPELLAAAGDGRLATPEGVAEQIDRLLGSDAVRKNINRVVLDWFGARQVLSKTTKSAVLLGSLTEANRDQLRLTGDLLAATQMFIDEVLWQTYGRVDDLILSRRMFVNGPLAALYGIPFSALPTQFVGAEFPEAEQRAGILTQPGVLWAVSDPEATSIVHRGLYVHNDILCLEPVPSPGDLLQQPEIKEALATLTTERERSDFRMTNAMCAGCHSDIDPYSLILENFDPVGAYRTVADGVPVDPTGEFSLSPSLMGPVTGAAAFAQAVVNDGLFTACATQKIASYAIGRSIRDRTTCEVKEVHARFTATDGTIQSLFREVALASFVRTRSGGDP